jgi:hypothetical protein
MHLIEFVVLYMVSRTPPPLLLFGAEATWFADDHGFYRSAKFSYQRLRGLLVVVFENIAKYHEPDVL